MIYSIKREHLDKNKEPIMKLLFLEISNFVGREQQRKGCRKAIKSEIFNKNEPFFSVSNMFQLYFRFE